MTFEKLLELLKEIMGANCNYENITLDTKIVEDLNMTSISLLMMYIRIQIVFGVELPEDILLPTTTVGDIVAYLDKK